MKEYLLFCMHVLNGWFDIPLKKHFPQSGLIERWKLTKQNDIPLERQKQNDIPQKGISEGALERNLKKLGIQKIPAPV